MKIVFILVYLGDERQLERQSHDLHRIRFTVALSPNTMYDLFDHMLFQLGLPDEDLESFSLRCRRAGQNICSTVRKRAAPSKKQK